MSLDVITRADVPSWTDDQWRGSRRTPPPSFRAVFEKARDAYPKSGGGKAETLSAGWCRRRAAFIMLELAKAGWVLVRDGQVVERNGVFEWRRP